MTAEASKPSKVTAFPANGVNAPGTPAALPGRGRWRDGTGEDTPRAVRPAARRQLATADGGELWRYRVVDAVSQALPTSPQPPADDLDAAVETARTEIARATQVSGLKNDPLVHLMQAVSASLEAQHRLHRASTGHLREVSGRLNQQVAEATTTAESAMAARQAAVVAQLAPQLAKITEQAVRVKLWTIKLRTLLLAGSAAAILGLTSLGTGYRLG